MQIGSVEALKAQMEKCIVSDCKDCPYTDAQICDTAMTKDALEYIESLEERITIMQESMAALEKRYEPNIMPLADVMGWMGETDESREPIYWENRFEKYENQWLLKPENPLYMINAIKAGRARAWTQKPTEEQSKAVKWE